MTFDELAASKNFADFFQRHLELELHIRNPDLIDHRLLRGPDFGLVAHGIKNYTGSFSVEVEVVDYGQGEASGTFELTLPHTLEAGDAAAVLREAWMQVTVEKFPGWEEEAPELFARDAKSRAEGLRFSAWVSGLDAETLLKCVPSVVKPGKVAMMVPDPRTGEMLRFDMQVEPGETREDIAERFQLWHLEALDTDGFGHPRENIPDEEH